MYIAVCLNTQHIDNTTWQNYYLINISTPVASMQRLMPFQDFFNLKTCLASRGSLGSVGAGGAGSGNPSAMTASFRLSTASS